MGAAEIVRLVRAAMERGWRFGPLVLVGLRPAGRRWSGSTAGSTTTRCASCGSWPWARRSCRGVRARRAGRRAHAVGAHGLADARRGRRRVAVHGAVLVAVAFSMTWTHDHCGLHPGRGSDGTSRGSRTSTRRSTSRGRSSSRSSTRWTSLPPGRAMWEYTSDLNHYGTTFALSLLPLFTDGHIGSMEGLYFESSATTAFHFLLQAELSTKPSQPGAGHHVRRRGRGGEAFRPDVFERGHPAPAAVRGPLLHGHLARAAGRGRRPHRPAHAWSPRSPTSTAPRRPGWGVYEVVGGRAGAAPAPTSPSWRPASTRRPGGRRRP